MQISSINNNQTNFKMAVKINSNKQKDLLRAPLYYLKKAENFVKDIVEVKKSTRPVSYYDKNIFSRLEDSFIRWVSK